MGPRTSSSKAQTSLASNDHITVVAAISTQDAPVPPFIIYPGAYLMEEWLKPRDREPTMMAMVSDSGWITGFLAMEWLTKCFDPATRDRADGARRLLILDGHETHVQVSFLEACWERDIVCLILPANMSNIFQPLDVDFFNLLKSAYHRQVDEYQLGSMAGRVTKAFFYQWLQRSWNATANSRQIRAAWAKSGLYPLNQVVMRAVASTPEPPSHQTEPKTPHNVRMIQEMDRQVRRGEISPTKAFLKTSKAFIKLSAKTVLLEQDQAKRQAANELDLAARRSNKRTRFPQGHLFDQKYQEEHAQELAERKEREKQSKGKKKAAARPRKQAGGSDSVHGPTAGPSTSG